MPPVIGRPAPDLIRCRDRAGSRRPRLAWLLQMALARISTKRGHEDLAKRFRAPVVAWHLVATRGRSRAEGCERAQVDLSRAGVRRVRAAARHGRNPQTGSFRVVRIPTRGGQLSRTGLSGSGVGRSSESSA